MVDFRGDPEMNAKLLGKYFGADRQWRGPCIVIVTANASIQTTGSDSILQGGTKSYSPRLISGRIQADSACLFPDEKALFLIQMQRIRQATGEDITLRTLIVVNLEHVVAIEFPDIEPLAAFGMEPPPKR
jgi:hypothetical protein